MREQKPPMLPPGAEPFPTPTQFQCPISTPPPPPSLNLFSALLRERIQEDCCCLPSQGVTSQTETLLAVHLQGYRERAVCAPNSLPFREARPSCLVLGSL